MDRSPEDEVCGNLPHCPHLPRVTRRLTADWTRVHRGRLDGVFYQASLEYAQSLWLEGKPAQAILQLNKAWSADLVGDEAVLREWPLPYRALVWVLLNSPGNGFLGNPVRHFQHLATRVRGPNATLRSWRAWACHHLSAMLLSGDDYPPDIQQIEREGLAIPEMEMVLLELHQGGIPSERDLIEDVIRELEKR